jgi:energy-coupling factor transporter ATP-binding protein EcfA2
MLGVEMKLMVANMTLVAPIPQALYGDHAFLQRAADLKGQGWAVTIASRSAVTVEISTTVHPVDLYEVIAAAERRLASLAADVLRAPLKPMAAPVASPEPANGSGEAVVSRAKDLSEDPADLPQLSAEQEGAIAQILRADRHVVLTGQAGSGKTTLIKHLARRVSIKTAATTAKAALLAGGCTVDAMFGLKRGDFETKIANMKRVAEIMPKLPRVLVIDEASMIGISMANAIEYVAKEFHKKLILVGDWAQASPVKDLPGVDSSLFRNSHFIKLAQNHRQGDGDYLTALNKIRGGQVDESVTEAFRPVIVTTPPEDDRYIRLCATRRAAGDYNQTRLAALPGTGRSITLTAVWTDVRSMHHQSNWPRQPDHAKALLDKTNLASALDVRIGARVVFTRNSQAHTWVNGDAGELVDVILADGSGLDDDLGSVLTPAQARVACLHVRLDRTQGVVAVERQAELLVDALGVETDSICGFPIQLGWAVTIHRAQGTTLDRAFLDMRTILSMPLPSRHGLAYVGLSRTRNLADLQIMGWCPQAVFCDDVVKPYL